MGEVGKSVFLLNCATLRLVDVWADGACTCVLLVDEFLHCFDVDNYHHLSTVLSRSYAPGDDVLTSIDFLLN